MNTILKNLHVAMLPNSKGEIESSEVSDKDIRGRRIVGPGEPKPRQIMVLRMTFELFSCACDRYNT